MKVGGVLVLCGCLLICLTAPIGVTAQVTSDGDTPTANTAKPTTPSTTPQPTTPPTTTTTSTTKPTTTPITTQAPTTTSEPTTTPNTTEATKPTTSHPTTAKPTTLEPTTLEPTTTTTTEPTTTEAIESNTTDPTTTTTTTLPNVEITTNSNTSSTATTVETTAKESSTTPTTTTTAAPRENQCDLDPCENGGTCANLETSYNCTCPTGYGGQNCSSDVDECETKSNDCDANANCTNTVGSYNCTCRDGFTGNGTSCTDVDECGTKSNGCDANANCTNTVGSYNCTCRDGFTGNGTSCTEINECDSTPCKNNGTCTDLVNSFNCTCQAGYEGLDCEIDINECERQNETCLNGGTCQDRVNNFTCQCPTQWEGFQCDTDVDECSKNRDKCHKAANCSNTLGGYNCTCNAGFKGDGVTCDDINECANDVSLCNGSKCFNTQGGYSCYCDAGWSGTNCEEDIDECAQNKCHENSNCTNTPGSYDCVCKTGYRGDGHHCVRKVLLEIMPGDRAFYGDKHIQPYNIPAGIPFHEQMYYTAFVSMDGFLSLGQEVSASYPPLKALDWAQYSVPIIAPFWADIETKEGSPAPAGMHVTEITNHTLLQGKGIDSYIPPNLRYCLMVTWYKAAPYPYASNGQSESADFQVLLMTNGSKSSVLFNYDLEHFTWRPTGGHLVNVGYSNRNFTGHVLFDSSNFTDVNDGHNTDVPGSWLFEVSSYTATLEAAADCYTKSTDAKFVDALSTTVTSSDPCPCSLQQGQLDLRYKEITGFSYKVFQPRFAKTDNTRQECHYDTAGSLLIGYPDGGYINGSQNIDNLHAVCCGNANMCQKFYQTVKSDDCSRYQPPIWALSFGDPHFTTVDGKTFPFNGRGEYLYIHESQSNLTVQIRTELVSQDNTDGTMIVGLAAQSNGSKTVEIRKNAAGNWTILPNPDEQLGPDGFLIDGSSSLTLVYASGIVIKVLKGKKSLNIVPMFPSNTNVDSGLLGVTTKNDETGFFMKNGTSLTLTSTEEELFPFGQSWMVSENESLFSHVLNNYNFYNNDTIRPRRYLGDLNETQLAAYIVTACPNQSINLEFCDNNKDCMIDTAVTCDTMIGNATKIVHDQVAKQHEEIRNEPPKVLNNSVMLHLYLDHDSPVTLNLAELIRDTNMYNVTIDTNIDSSQYSFEHSFFEWNTSNTLRSESVYLKFTAYDELGASAQFWPRISYCGCEDRQQCDDHTAVEDDRNRFYRVPCTCPPDSKGTFCETVDVCLSSPCYSNVTCNSSNMNHPCGDCPPGMTGDGHKCYHDDPCFPNPCGENAKCQESKPGESMCDCLGPGYSHDRTNISCVDKDECLTASNNPCKGDNTVCKNTEGSYTCDCSPGFYNTSSDSSCQRANYTVVIGLEIQTEQTNRTKIIAAVDNLMKDIFTDITGLTYEIHLTQMVNRRRRDTSELIIYHVDSIVYSDNTPVSKINDTFNNYVSKSETNNHIDVLQSDIPITVIANRSRVYQDEDNRACQIEGVAACDPVSTVCMVNQGVLSCHCKPGFQGWQSSYASCKDVDECSDENNCVGGICTNRPGGFDCKCRVGFEYKNKQCVDVCLPNPCKNGGHCDHDAANSFKCTCQGKWTGNVCDREHAEVSKLRTIAIAVGAGAGAICLLLFFAFIGMWRRNKARKLRGNFMDMEALTRTQNDYGQQSLFDDSNTTFSIPRAKLTQKVEDEDKDTESKGLEEGATSATDDSQSRFSIPRPKVAGPDAYTRGSKKVIDGKGDVHIEPLERTHPVSGEDNQSFLHSPKRESERKSMNRSGRNAYEYF